MTHDTQAFRVIMGLGNPDPALLDTYHNAGMLALPAIAAALTGSEEPLVFKRYKDLFEYAEADGISFVKPLTYMNDSGRAAKEALRVLKADPVALAVAHDDSDLPVGSFKIVRGGGTAGHKGIISIVEHLHTPDFLRIRIGIRDPREVHRKKAADFVLSSISPKDREALTAAFAEIGATLLRTLPKA